MRNNKEQEETPFYLRNETLSFARHLGVRDEGIEILANIEAKLQEWYCLGERVCQELEELYKHFEKLHPGVHAKIQKHRVTVAFPKGKRGRRPLDKVTKALRLRSMGKDWQEIVLKIHGPSECRAIGPRGRKNLIRYYQIMTASRRRRQKMTIGK